MSVLKTPIVEIKQIDTETPEGRLLIASISILSRVQDKSPASVLTNLNSLAAKIYDNPDGHITKRSSGAELKTAVRGANETRESRNPDMGDEV